MAKGDNIQGENEENQWLFNHLTTSDFTVFVGALGSYSRPKNGVNYSSFLCRSRCPMKGVSWIWGGLVPAIIFIHHHPQAFPNPRSGFRTKETMGTGAWEWKEQTPMGQTPGTSCEHPAYTFDKTVGCLALWRRLVVYSLPCLLLLSWNMQQTISS